MTNNNNAEADSYYTLENIVEQLTSLDDNMRSEVYTTKAALRERFKKLLNYMKMDADSLKNQKKEIFFYEEDVPFVKALLIELGEPYLQRLTSSKRIATTISDSIAEAAAFRVRMIKRMELANPDAEARKSWEGTIEILSRHQLLQVQDEIMKKLVLAGDKIIEKHSYTDCVTLLSEVNNAVDQWIQERINRD